MFIISLHYKKELQEVSSIIAEYEVSEFSPTTTSVDFEQLKDYI